MPNRFLLSVKNPSISRWRDARVTLRRRTNDRSSVPLPRRSVKLLVRAARTRGQDRRFAPSRGAGSRRRSRSFYGISSRYRNSFMGGPNRIGRAVRIALLPVRFRAYRAVEHAVKRVQPARESYEIVRRSSHTARRFQPAGRCTGWPDRIQESGSRSPGHRVGPRHAAPQQSQHRSNRITRQSQQRSNGAHSG
jgi:hypothetical protein